MASNTDEVQNPELLRKKKIFYELCADWTFKFGDGKTLKINKAYLAAKSDVFLKFFCESGSKNVCEVQDYDLPTFKLFLDCLMGFQKCLALDALLVLPLALKYETEEFFSKCEAILKPSTLNENVCLTLNTAIVCNCKKLTNSLRKFLVKNNYIEIIMEEEKYYSLLQPESVALLLNYVKMDSYLLQNVFKWGKNYLKKNNWRVNLKLFFKEHKMIDKLTLTCFETTQAILDFNKSELGNNFFPDLECWAHVKEHGFDPRRSEWFKLREGDKIIESFVIPDVTFLRGYTTTIDIVRNEIVVINNQSSDSRHLNKEESDGSDLDDLSSGDDDVYMNNEEVLQWHATFTMKNVAEFSQNSNIIEVTEEISKSKKNYLFSIKYDETAIRDLIVEIEFVFRHDCRILVTSPGPTPVQANAKNRYFTYLMKFSHSPKVEVEEAGRIEKDFYGKKIGRLRKYRVMKPFVMIDPNTGKDVIANLFE